MFLAHHLTPGHHLPLVGAAGHRNCKRLANNWSRVHLPWQASAHLRRLAIKESSRAHPSVNCSSVKTNCHYLILESFNSTLCHLHCPRPLSVNVKHGICKGALALPIGSFWFYHLLISLTHPTQNRRDTIRCDDQLPCLEASKGWEASLYFAHSIWSRW